MSKYLTDDEIIPKPLAFTASISPAAIILTLKWVIESGNNMKKAPK